MNDIFVEWYKIYTVHTTHNPTNNNDDQYCSVVRPNHHRKIYIHYKYSADQYYSEQSNQNLKQNLLTYILWQVNELKLRSKSKV